MLLAEHWPGRESQARQLSVLLSPSRPSPSNLVIHGPEATGKTGLLLQYLESSLLSHAIINCRECITGRHLLERTATACLDTLPNTQSPALLRCENLAAFANTMERMLRPVDKFVLVLDAIDEQREAAPTLLPALARMGTMIPGLTVVFVVRHSSPRSLHATGIPHVYFPPYNREQSIRIASAHPPRIWLRALSPSMDYDEDIAAEDDAWLWGRFCQAVWDSLGKGTARDVVTFRSVATRLWRPFIQPVVNGTFGTRDFSRLLVAQRSLLQDESYLVDMIVADPESKSETSLHVPHDLPYYSKWLLCAAYLASFNPARQDSLYFMKATERKRRKKGGGTAVGRQSKQRKISRHLLSATPFTVDRLLAIMHAILPHDLLSNLDMYTQLATLGSLRLLVRSGAVGADLLEPGSKWKVNFGWDYAMKQARSLKFDMTDFVAE